jgi:hypothetical protein
MAFPCPVTSRCTPAGGSAFASAAGSGTAEPASNPFAPAGGHGGFYSAAHAGSVDQLAAQAAGRASGAPLWRCFGAGAPPHKPSHSAAVPVYVMLPLDTVRRRRSRRRRAHGGRGAGVGRPRRAVRVARARAAPPMRPDCLLGAHQRSGRPAGGPAPRASS